MDGAHEHLIKTSPGKKLTYTSELWPEEDAAKEMYVSDSETIPETHCLL